MNGTYGLAAVYALTRAEVTPEEKLMLLASFESSDKARQSEIACLTPAKAEKALNALADKGLLMLDGSIDFPALYELAKGRAPRAKARVLGRSKSKEGTRLTLFVLSEVADEQGHGRIEVTDLVRATGRSKLAAMSSLGWLREHEEITFETHKQAIIFEIGLTNEPVDREPVKEEFSKDLDAAMMAEAAGVLATSPKVKNKKVTVAEMEIAVQLLTIYNNSLEQRRTLVVWHECIVERIREYPTMTIEEHVAVANAALRVKWWERSRKGRRSTQPTPKVIWGNAQVFDNAMQDVSEKDTDARKSYRRKAPVASQ